MPKLRADNGFEISLYDDEKPSIDDFKTASNRLSIAFPKMSKEFFVLLTEFVIKENFSAKRLADAVNHIIINFQYKELNISDIIRFDKRVKLYTYNEVVRLVEKGEAKFSEFEIREIEQTFFRVKKTDLI